MGVPIGNIKDVFSFGKDADKQKRELIRIAIFVEEGADPQLLDLLKEHLSPQTGSGLIHVEKFRQAQDCLINTQSDCAVIVSADGDEAALLYALFKKSQLPACVLSIDEAKAHRLLKLAPFAAAEDFLWATGPAQMQEKLARWILDHNSDKELAFAYNFPFVRRVLANKIVADTAKQNALVGGIVIIPGADMPVMTANQAKMVLQIAAAYGQELGAARIKELLGVLASAFAFRTIARQALTFVPALGWALKAAIGYSATMAMGKLVIEYFEEGGSAGSLAKKLKDSSSELIQKAVQSSRDKFTSAKKTQ